MSRESGEIMHNPVRGAEIAASAGKEDDALRVARAPCRG
jgi:hypothetical protein